MKTTRIFILGILAVAGMFAGSPAHCAQKENGEALLIQAEELSSLGDDTGADALFHRALETRLSRKQKYEAYLALGKLAMKHRKYAQAIENYREAESLSPGNEKALLALGTVYEESDLYELARIKYQEILDHDRKSYEANFRLGRLLLKQGMNTKAMEYFRRALTLRSSAEIYRCMSACAERSGDIGIAIAMLRQSAQMGLNYDDFITLGRLYGRQKRIADAEETFGRAIKLDPDRGEGYFYLALLYLENGRIMPSEKLLAMAQEKAPDEGLVHFFLSIIAYHHHDPAGALQEINAAERMAGTEELKSYSRRFRAFLEQPSTRP